MFDPMDRARFEELALKELDACHRLAMQLTRSAEEAADLVQETYLRALKSVESAGPEGFTPHGGGVRAWLFTIMHNTFFSQRVKKSGREMQAGAVEGVPGVPESADPLPGEPPPAWDLRSLDWNHVDTRLKKAIDALSPEQREVLLLWGVEGMKYREIAGVLDVPIGTVMSRLYRARAILAESLEHLRRDLGSPE